MHKILFVCHGNICRSPMAEFIMKDMVKKRHIEKDFYIESCAISSEEIGNTIDYRAKRILNEHNIFYHDRRARKITHDDYDKFDYIIYMDEENRYFLNYVFPDDKENKMHKLLDFTSYPRDVSDPWYSGNFSKAYDDIVMGIESFLNYLGY